LLNKAESVIKKGLRRFREKKSVRKRSKMSKKACTPYFQNLERCTPKKSPKNPLLKTSKYPMSGNQKKKIVG